MLAPDCSGPGETWRLCKAASLRAMAAAAKSEMSNEQAKTPAVARITQTTRSGAHNAAVLYYPSN